MCLSIKRVDMFKRDLSMVDKLLVSVLISGVFIVCVGAVKAEVIC